MYLYIVFFCPVCGYVMRGWTVYRETSRKEKMAGKRKGRKVKRNIEVNTLTNLTNNINHSWELALMIWISCFQRFFNLVNFQSFGYEPEEGTAYPSRSPEFTPGFSGIRVTRSLAVCVSYEDRCLSFCPFFFCYCVVCSSPIYELWLHLWYLQTLLIQERRCAHWFWYLHFD